jgi:hypothetical protein
MALWTPADITTALWLSDTGSSAAIWPDLSGNSRDATQSLISAQPLIAINALNGKQVRRFDGDDFLQIADRSLLRNIPAASFFVVFSTTTIAAGQAAIFSYITSVSGNLFYFAREGSAIFFGGRRVGGTSGDFDTFGTLTTNTYFIGSCQLRWSVAEKEAFLLPSSTLLDSSFQNAGNSEDANSAFDPTIGRSADGSFQFLNGDMAEIIMLQQSTVTADRHRIEGYLAHKWGLTGSLPSDHPYKNAAPTTVVFSRRRRSRSGGGVL